MSVFLENSELGVQKDIDFLADSAMADARTPGNRETLKNPKL